jgi:hypothetical protein
LTLTTAVLAARVDKNIYAGIAAADAHRTKPGRAWKCLQPWLKGRGPAGKSKEKSRRWIQAVDVLRIS